MIFARRVLLTPVIAIEMTGRDVADNSVSKSSVSILQEGTVAGRGAGSGGECAN